VASLAIKGNRQIVRVVVVLVSLAFLGISLAPLLGGIFRNQASLSNQDTNTGNVSQEFTRQARGYELVLEREPDNQNALGSLLEIRQKSGDRAGTIPLLEKLVELNPGQEQYMLSLARTQEDLEETEGAVQTYQDFLGTYPNKTVALQAYAAFLLRQDQSEAAITLLNEALERAPSPSEVNSETLDTTGIRLVLSRAYLQRGQVDEGMAIYDQAIADAPGDFRAPMEKALALSQQGQLGAAEELFAQAKELAPETYKSQIEVIAQQEREKATATPSTSEDSQPDSGELVSSLGAE